MILFFVVLFTISLSLEDTIDEITSLDDAIPAATATESEIEEASSSSSETTKSTDTTHQTETTTVITETTEANTTTAITETTEANTTTATPENPDAETKMSDIIGIIVTTVASIILLVGFSLLIWKCKGKCHKRKSNEINDLEQVMLPSPDQPFGLDEIEL